MVTAPQSIDYLVRAGGPITGRIRVPGDKSISHRAIMLSALAEGSSGISGFLNGEDTIATMDAFRQMGIEINYDGGTDVTVHGKGLDGLKPPTAPLNLGNSGTSVRLLAGILAGQSFASEMTGDASLSLRPMRRIVDPLTDMGAQITCSDDGTLPIYVQPSPSLRGLDFDMPVASAQLKSCLLLAGLYSQKGVCVTEPATTRDHTERMLQHMGCPTVRHNNRICMTRQALQASDIQIPGDISSAAFFMVAASIVPGSEIILENIGINPTRHAVIEILQSMGASISLEHLHEVSGEPVADIHVQYSKLAGIAIPGHLVPIAIDEFPIIFIAAAFAEGETCVSGASELKLKESDRIEAMAKGLARLGIEADARADGLVVKGGLIQGGEVESYTDHRIAMAFAIAGLGAKEPVRIRDCANVATSFPGFPELAGEHGASIQLIHND